MTNRFTSKAQHALNSALAQAGQMGHTYVGSEHILLGLLDDPESTSAKLLEGKGIKAMQVKEAVEEFAGVVRRLAAKHGIPVPANDFFYQRIREIEAAY